MDKKFVLVALSFLFSIYAMAGKTYHEIKVFNEINATSWSYLKNGLDEARKQKSDAVFLHLNTYGGEVVYADSMRTAILNNEIPVYVFIDNNAASAGALISIAGDSIFMRQGGNIGAATVVNQNGEKMMDKYQSYMRSIIRSTAEAHGKVKRIENGDTIEKWFRDPHIAEAMVDEHIHIPGIIDSTHILTFTAEEAKKNGFCEGIYESLDEIIVSALHETDYEVKSYNPTLFENIKGWLLNPALQGILIMLIIGGIYFEMQTPGIGFALAVSVIAGLLYFAPLFMDGLADYWELGIVIVGLILILLEIFVIPGFGVAGISGIILFVFGLLLCMIPNHALSFDAVSQNQLAISFGTLLFSIIGSTTLILYLSSKIGKDGIFKNLALNTSLDEDPQKKKESNSLIGQKGVTTTPLCPSGKVSLNGEIFNAVSENGYVEKGKTVVVRKYSTGQIYVREEE